MAGNINTAYGLVIQACNDPYIGYSQPNRYSIKLGVNYRTYCDCSSLIAWALYNAGFYTTNPWFTTSVMESSNVLQNAGFHKYPASSVQWDAGDIVWRRGHTEMVYQANGVGGVTMGAHEPKNNYADEVSINSRVSSAANWTYIYKIGEAAEYSGPFDPPTEGENVGNPVNDDAHWRGVIDWELRRRLVKPR